MQSDFGCNPTQTILDGCCAGLLVYYSTPTTIAWPLPPTVYYYSLHIRRACRAIACARSESTCLSRSTGSRGYYLRESIPARHDGLQHCVCDVSGARSAAGYLAPTFGRISLTVCHGPGKFVPPSISVPFRAARHGHRPMRPGWSGAFA